MWRDFSLNRCGYLLLQVDGSLLSLFFKTVSAVNLFFWFDILTVKCFKVYGMSTGFWFVRLCI